MHASCCISRPSWALWEYLGGIGVWRTRENKMCIALSIRPLTLRHMALRARRPAGTEALRAQLCVRIFTRTLLCNALRARLRVLLWEYPGGIGVWRTKGDKMCIALSIHLLTPHHMALRARRPACTKALRAQLCVRIFTFTSLTHCGQGPARSYSLCVPKQATTGSAAGTRPARELVLPTRGLS